MLFVITRIACCNSERDNYAVKWWSLIVRFCARFKDYMAQLICMYTSITLDVDTVNIITSLKCV